MPLGLLTFHHFHSSKKLTHLHALTSTHSLHGLYQRGRPGILLLSGDDQDSLLRCIRDVKRMRWQRVLVRGVAAEMGLGVSGLVEVEGRVRDVVAAAGRFGGVQVEGWVKERMGLGKGGVR